MCFQSVFASRQGGAPGGATAAPASWWRSGGESGGKSRGKSGRRSGAACRVSGAPRTLNFAQRHLRRARGLGRAFRLSLSRPKSVHLYL